MRFAKSEWKSILESIFSTKYNQRIIVAHQRQCLLATLRALKKNNKPFRTWDIFTRWSIRSKTSGWLVWWQPIPRLSRSPCVDYLLVSGQRYNKHSTEYVQDSWSRLRGIIKEWPNKLIWDLCKDVLIKKICLQFLLRCLVDKARMDWS